MACPQIVAPDVIANVAAIGARAAPTVTPLWVGSPFMLGGIATCCRPECNSGMVLRTGKAGAYRYYVRNRKAMAGATSCPSRVPGTMLRAEIIGQNTVLRRSYVPMLVGIVPMNDNEIVIAGSTAALEAAATNNSINAGPAVRGFYRKWCASPVTLRTLLCRTPNESSKI